MIKAENIVKKFDQFTNWVAIGAIIATIGFIIYKLFS